MSLKWQDVVHAAKVAGVKIVNTIPRIRKLTDGSWEVTWTEPRLALPAPGKSVMRNRAVLDAPDAESAEKIASALREADERAKTEAEKRRAEAEERAKEARHARANLADAKDQALKSMQQAEDEARQAKKLADDAQAEADREEKALADLRAEIKTLEARTEKAKSAAATAVIDRANAQAAAKAAMAAQPDALAQVQFLKDKLAEAVVAATASSMVKDYTFLGGMHQLMVLPKPEAKRGRKVMLTLAEDFISEPKADNFAQAEAQMTNGLPHPTIGNGNGFLATKDGGAISVLVEHNPIAFDVRTEEDEASGKPVTSLYVICPDYSIRIRLS